MHDIMPPLAATAQVIQSYGPAGFRIGGVMHATHVLVLPTATYAWNGELTLEGLQIPPPIGGRLGGGLTQTQTSESSPHPASPRWGERLSTTEILLIGTGKHHEMLNPVLRKALKDQGIGIDTMDTGAACRTFNVLLGEGRNVAVALRLPA